MNSNSLVLEDPQLELQRKLQEAIPAVIENIKRNPLFWLRKFTKTFNPQWKEQGFNGPFQPFPHFRNFEDGLDYLDYLFDYLKPKSEMQIPWNLERVPDDPAVGAYERVIEKSRTMLGTWSCIGYFTHRAMTVPGQEFIFQSQTQEKAEELIDYSKILWDQQPAWLKQAFPMARRLDDFPKDKAEWGNKSRIIAIPSDPSKVRMFHPTGMLIDEAAFISEFRRNRETALPACRMIVELSSAGPSEFADWANS